MITTDDDLSEEEALEAVVKAFSKKMKERCRDKMLEGVEGWDNTYDRPFMEDRLRELASESLTKKSLVDIANFAMFLENMADE